MGQHLPPASQSCADMVVIHGVAWLVVNIHRDDARRQMICNCVREALPKVSRGVPMIAELARVAEDLIVDAPHWSVRNEAAGLLERMHMAKLGSALEVLRSGETTRRAM
ncbi:hypothetical protein OE699_01905 [Sedimentimonas flavescens]|uniref:HEAT repeat protein n=1 Tax=Sedimentimonas flavescens TaxID=2851012 RepID=A0ABT2ZV23_9RHOB|nr:hypothetical protein [Sedimentimonas flavescens]MCV2877593.1 hypothetical protein [Sedimentimonas flavescens]